MWIRKLKLLLFTGLCFNVAGTVSANCYGEGINVRLGNYCALQKIKRTPIGLKTAQFIDYKLKVEGERSVFRFPTRVPKHSLAKTITPILYYSDNINGGNSPRPLVLGGLTFKGDEHLYKKEGVVAGLAGSVSGRYIHGNGRYLSYSLSASHAQSVRYALGIVTTGANVCSVNRIKNWWYVDVCANTSRTTKDITDSTNSNVTLTSSKVFEVTEDIFSEASIGVNRMFSENYTQNQLTLGYDAITTNGLTTSIDVKFGEKIANQIVTKFSATGSISGKVAEKPLTLVASYSEAGGGKLLGFRRDEKTYTLSVYYPVFSSIRIGVGYMISDSTIDYFDSRKPSFSVHWAPWRI